VAAADLGLDPPSTSASAERTASVLSSPGAEAISTSTASLSRDQAL
jgi:hypothetical protein